MIDLHCHILPNTDDGPTSLKESLEMARFMVADGTTVVTATPHCHRYIHLLRPDILPRVEQLNVELAAAEIPLNVLPGSEIQVTDSQAYRREFEMGLFCHLGDSKSYTLLEFNWARDLFPVDATSLIKWIHQQGMKPIIAHPERHDFFIEQPDLLRSLVDEGAWVQITVDSLLGNHGPDAKSFADKFLRQFPDAILATDAHHMRRCSGLTPGYEWVREHLGSARANDLKKRADQVERALLKNIATP